MILKSLELANFRKFRDPLRIDAFTSGLNIVVEPNETGKSTLLEALRAAFFVRHSTKNELVRSYVPLNDDVAPRVGVEFVVGGETWNLEKQFLKPAFARLSGPTGRKDSDAAEDALQELLGFERGNNRGSDPETRGPLGMLWVEQASALSVERPNRIVRDSVRGVLEAEVGAVTGGRRFDAIRASVETAYTALRTPKNRAAKGDLATAEKRVMDASAARQASDATLRSYEQALSELANARASLRIVEQDIADPEVAAERKRLDDDLRLGESAALRLATAKAQFDHAEELARTASSRLEALGAAESRLKTAKDELASKTSARDEAAGAVTAAAAEEERVRSSLETAREARQGAETLNAEAAQRARAFAAAAGARRAVEARNALAQLEDRERELAAEADRRIDQDELDHLQELERAALEARVRLEAGAVRIDLELADGVDLLLDGETSEARSIDVLVPTCLTIGEAGSMTVRPPSGSGPSIEADLAAAEQELAAALRALAVPSHAAAVAVSEKAAAAERELKTVRAQIAAACPGDPTIGLAKGADALRSFVASLNGGQAAEDAPGDDIEAIEAALSEARAEESRALGRHDDARSELGRLEGELATAVAEFGSAEREHGAATRNLQERLMEGDREKLSGAVTEAQRDKASKLETFEAAKEAATAFDVTAIRRKIENKERAAQRASDDRLDLARRIAGLEATIAREGTAGPAGVAQAAAEEEEAAMAACERLRREADVLEVLRTALSDAAEEASRTFLAPVTKRASGHIERLLPGCKVTFDEELGLTSVIRAGLDESCGDLSKGTQEQLAILTRLAFADLLLEDGAPISLILDDPLVFSDDARLEVMTDILQEAAGRMQVILLTCRSKAFRHVDANRIVLR